MTQGNMRRHHAHVHQSLPHKARLSLEVTASSMCAEEDSKTRAPEILDPSSSVKEGSWGTACGSTPQVSHAYPGAKRSAWDDPWCLSAKLKNLGDYSVTLDLMQA